MEQFVSLLAYTTQMSKAGDTGQIPHHFAARFISGFTIDDRKRHNTDSSLHYSARLRSEADDDWRAGRLGCFWRDIGRSKMYHWLRRKIDRYAKPLTEILRHLERYVVSLANRTSASMGEPRSWRIDGESKKVDHSLPLIYSQPLYDYIQRYGTLYSRSLVRPKPPN